MKARVPVAVASTAILLCSIPIVSDASRIPSRPAVAPEIRDDSDPWVPDNREPARMLQAPPIQSAVAPENGGTSLEPSAVRHRWHVHLLRLLQALRLGGILR